MTYQADVLQHYQGEMLSPLAAQQRDHTIAEQFGNASLFIDDCPDLTTCSVPDGGACSCQIVGSLPGGPVGQCWHWSDLSCKPCNGQSEDHYAGVCNSTYPACHGNCGVG